MTTPDSSHPDLNIVAVSHDRPGELPSGGEANLWAGLAERLSSPWQGVEAVIHLGGQVQCKGGSSIYKMRRHHPTPLVPLHRTTRDGWVVCIQHLKVETFVFGFSMLKSPWHSFSISRGVRAVRLTPWLQQFEYKSFHS